MRHFTSSFLALLLLGMSPVLAQTAEDASITGTVIEAETGEPVEAATVAAYLDSDSTMAAGVATNQDGSFELTDLGPGSYYVEVQFLGFETITLSDVEPGEGEVVELGEIALIPDDRELGELDVVAERDYQEQGIDRTIYNTRDQPLSAGGSAINVLETIPSVEVDLNGNISLRGSQGVEIYLNGRPAPMTGEALTGFLRGLNADDVERIETIPNPSASHQPEGSSGVINIVLTQDAGAGLGGGLSVSASTNDRYGGSGNIRYGSADWSVNANYGLRYSERSSSNEYFRENRYLNPVTFLEHDGESSRAGLSQYLNTNIEYNLGERDVLSLAAILSTRSNESESLSQYEQLDQHEILDALYSRNSFSDDGEFEMDYRLDYRRVIDPGSHELVVEARYERELEGEQNRYVNNVMQGNDMEEVPEDEEQRVDEDERSHDASLEVDYERPLGDNVKLETGYRGSFERLESSLFSESRVAESAQFSPDVERINSFLYDEILNAGYAVVGAQMGQFGAQFGLRLEQANTRFDQEQGDVYNNQYFSFFPSLHLSYNPVERLTLKSSYSKRVDRPNTWQLNPFDDQQDPRQQRIGNPFLEPEYTHSGEIAATLLGDAYSATVSTYYRHTRNAISWNEQLNDQGVSIQTFENFTTRDSYGFELNGSYRPLDALRISAGFNGYRRVTDGSNVDDNLTNGALGFSTHLRGSWEVRPGLDVQLRQYYRAPMEVAGGRRSARSRTSLALRQELMDGQMQINLSARDVFDTRDRESIRDTERYFQRSLRSRESRGVRLSLRYNFNRPNQGGGRRGRR